MAGSRALPDLVARIRVDSSGVDQAIGQLIGSFGKADLALAGVAAGIGLLVIGGKSMIDIAERQDSAQRGLEQAYQSSGTNLAAYRDQIAKFLDENRKYYNNQSDVIDGFAKLTRSGLTQTEVQKDMNRAIDLAALKHISLSDAVQILDQAEHGRLKGLSDLGITTAKYTDAQGQQIASSKDVGKAMDELDQKTKGGRGTLTLLEQDSNKLNNDWQDLSKKGGPVLLTLLDDIAKGASGIYDWFDKIGHDDKMWAAISDRLVKMASWIRQYVVNPLKEASDALNANPTIEQAYKNYQKNTSQMAPRAAGGPVVPGGVYTVGENGPETLVMGGNGGMVIPNGGAAGMVHITNNQPIILDGAVIGRLIDRRIARSRIGSS